MITGNTATGNGLDGIIIQTNGNTISNNVLSDNVRNGILLDGSGTDNVVVGNVAQNVTTTSQQRGIYEDAGPDFNLITGNSGRNNALTPGIVKTGANTIMVNNQGQ
jgi:parallel beta-helix repeat protein